MYNSRTAVRDIVELQFKISRYTNLAQDIAYTLNVNRSRDFMIYVDAPRECPASPLTYLGSENRITSISSAASGPFRFSRAPSSLYLVVESLCLSRSRARSYNAGAAMGAGEGESAGFYARFIDLSPSTFTLPSHMPHPTLAFPRRRTFHVASHDAVGKPEKTPEKQDVFCLLNTPRLKHGGHRPEREHKGPLVKIISRCERLR